MEKIFQKELAKCKSIHMASQHNIVKTWRLNGFVVTKTKWQDKKGELNAKQI
jgi:hypothetical protein